MNENLTGIWDLDVFDVAEQTLDECPEQIPFDDFDGYRLIERIGGGGMGEVFLAEDKEVKRPVAIKFLRTCWFETDRRERSRAKSRRWACWNIRSLRGSTNPVSTPVARPISSWSMLRENH